MKQEKEGAERSELDVGILEDGVTADAFARIIDLFVEQLGDLSQMGIIPPPEGPWEKKGAPAYSHSALLKYYLYGYGYGIRSSRGLTSQCRINIEMMWLMRGLKPKYHTISDFRRKYSKALNLVFAVEGNHGWVEENKALYSRRRILIEQPFGTIKRGWGYNCVAYSR